MIGETPIEKQLRLVKSLNDAVAWYDANIKPSNKNFLMDLIRIEQLRKRQIAGDGDIIGTYSMTTQQIAKENPPASGRPKIAGQPYNLEWDGDFFRQMFVVVLRDALVVESNSKSFREMQAQDWWKDEIMELTKENLQKYSDRIRTDYLNYVRKTLQINE
jgi:hypothetical protein